MNLVERSFIFAALGFSLFNVAQAQQAASVAGTGTVTGHVICGDTQRPARFASVTLLGVPSEVTVTPKLDPNADEATQMAAMKKAMASFGKTSFANAVTDTNGAYTMTDLAPGDYYVFGAQAGYVSPTDQVKAVIAAGADTKKMLPGIPVVHVVAEHSATGDATIERGGAVSGNVLWDDGTPVSGAIVSAMPPGKETDVPSEFAMLAASGIFQSLLGISDDQGHFRLSGLRSGEYLISVKLKASNGLNMTSGSFKLSKMIADMPLVIYAPAAFHKGDAKAVTLHASEDVRDQVVTVNLGGLRSVSGRVGSAEDHHGLNSATVTLTDAQDKEFSRSASVDASGNFTVTFLPPGTYDLKVSDAGDTQPEKKSDKKQSLLNFSSDKTVRSYEEGKQSVIVSDSDIAGLNIELVPSKTVKKDVDYGDLFKQ
jgi:hypothetical protein